MKTTTFTHNASMSWADFAEMTKAGFRFEIGTKITDTLKDGTEISTVLIHYRDHKDKNEAVFAFERCPFRCEMNDDYTNTGGYEVTKLRKKLAEFFDMLPDELRAVIKKKKIVQTMGDEVHKFKDKLWIPSEYEVFGEEHWGKQEETDVEQFEYFKEPINRVHRVEDECSACGWWLSSPYVSSATIFCAVASAGAAYSGSASGSNGVLPCFLIAADA